MVSAVKWCQFWFFGFSQKTRVDTSFLFTEKTAIPQSEWQNLLFPGQPVGFEEKPEKRTSRWWILVILLIIIFFGIGTLVYRKKLKRKE